MPQVVRGRVKMREGWIKNGHIKYWWELSRFQKVIVLVSFVVVWLGLWALLNLARFGLVWPS